MLISIFLSIPLLSFSLLLDHEKARRPNRRRGHWRPANCPRPLHQRSQRHRSRICKSIRRSTGSPISLVPPTPSHSHTQVGAGIRVPPNSSRLSRSWGVDFSKVKKEVSLGNRFVDWKGNILLDCDFQDVESRYGAPYYFIHRADLVKLLVETVRAKPNVQVRMGCRVASYGFDAPSVTFADGEVLKADLVVCADGIKSTVRDTINGRPLPPQDTGDVAYRILVPAAPLLADPQMAHLVRNPWAVHWMGPEGHAVGYPLREGELYNIIIDVTHSSDLGEPIPESGQVWKSARSNQELVERFKDWCPEVKKLCAMTGEYLKWKLADFEALDHWVSESGKACLLGDSCHPMMPYSESDAFETDSELR